MNYPRAFAHDQSGADTFIRAGVNRAQEREWRKAHPHADATLDLHGHSRDSAKMLLKKFFEEAQVRGNRYIKIIHGKGSYVLRDWLYQHLPTDEAVLAFCPARQNDGGTGAMYLLLRKL